MAKKRINAYWLLLLVLIYTASVLLGVGESQARYTNTITGKTMVRSQTSGVTSNCLVTSADPALTVLAGKMSRISSTTIDFWLLSSGKGATGVLRWGVSDPELAPYVKITMQSGADVITPESEIELLEDVPMEFSMIITPTDKARAAVNTENIKIHVLVTWGESMWGTFQVILPAVENAAPEEPTVPAEPDGDNTGNEDPEGGNTEGGNTEGDNTEGDNTEGDNTEGGNTEGGNTEGGNTEGDNTEGGNTEGGNTEGGNTEGGNTEGSNTEGGNTEGGNTEGGNTEGDNTEGGNTEGGNTEGGNTEGGNTEGGNTEGGNAEGGNTEGSNTEGSNTEGGNTEGDNTEGGNTEGGNTEGGNTEGGNTEGGNTEGGNTEGGDTEGGNTESDNTEGSNTEGGDTEGGNTEGGNTEGDETEDNTTEEIDPSKDPIRLETLSRFDSGGMLPVQIVLTEDVTDFKIGLGVIREENAEDPENPRAEILPLPRYTRFSLDGGESYYMLYEDLVAEFFVDKTTTIPMLLDFRYTGMENGTGFLLAMEAYAGADRAANCYESTICSTSASVSAAVYNEAAYLEYLKQTQSVTEETIKKPAAQKGSYVLNQDNVLVLTLPQEWDEAEMEYSVELLTLAEDKSLAYKLVDLSASGLLAEHTENEQVHDLVISIGDKLPQAGTYRINMQWTYEGICYIEKQITFFINYTAHAGYSLGSLEVSNHD